MSERVGHLLCVMTLLFCHITLGERFSKKEGEGIWVECFVPPENVQIYIYIFFKRGFRLFPGVWVLFAHRV